VYGEREAAPEIRVLDHGGRSFFVSRVGTVGFRFCFVRLVDYVGIEVFMCGRDLGRVVGWSYSETVGSFRLCCLDQGFAQPERSRSSGICDLI
jgi:hypothetical protein